MRAQENEQAENDIFADLAYDDWKDSIEEWGRRMREYLKERLVVNEG